MRSVALRKSAPQPARGPVTVARYERMIAEGILTKDDRVELINGVIVDMSPIGSPHGACVDRLNELLARRFRGRVIVRVQGAIVLGSRDEPQPDLALLRPRPDYYARRNPRPTDVLLVIEVADTSLERDRRLKLPRYAATGIAEVWIVDLMSEVVEVYRKPRAGGYRQVETLGLERRIVPLAFPRSFVRGAEILG
jgi:hypothetical protein